ncbi:hypothetical protein CLV88_101128 [Shimia abyssi]|uniref:Uncharacterized protein n=1 Tax=Shimia abyssi TaxID=1662395 RepID=A0A2P8FJ04_9RHOB|nr:hypothetical protein CLV88_101128 [Shimia abyssi]
MDLLFVFSLIAVLLALRGSVAIQQLQLLNARHKDV